MSRSFVIVVSLLVGLLAVSCLELVRELRLQKQAVAQKENELDLLRAELQKSADQISMAEGKSVLRAEELVELQKRNSKLEQEAGRSTNEAARVREQLALLQKQITAESKELQSAPGDRAKGGGPGAQNNSSAPSEREALEANFCRNHLAQIGIAAQLWAEGHENRAPATLLDLKQYLAPMILVCPSASPHPLARGWSEFNPADVTYRVNAHPVDWGPNNFIFAFCPIHKIYLSGGGPGFVTGPPK